MKRLEIDDGGVWRVSTEASAYILDLDRRWGYRLPGEGLGVHPDTKDRIVLTLPLDSDNSKFHLDSLYCVVGRPMYIEHDDTRWIRSTLVRKIELVEE